MEEQQTLGHEGASAGEEDEAPTLSLRAIVALQQFLAEQKRSEEAEETNGETSVELVSEDWRLSQFWYEKSTAETVAKEVISPCGDSGRVACIACPTLYAYIKKIDPNLSVQLLEYDERFGRYRGDFTFYDYNKPEELPAELKQCFSVVVADPPYLSKECLEKVAETVSFLAKPDPSNSYVLLLTGLLHCSLSATLQVFFWGSISGEPFCWKMVSDNAWRQILSVLLVIFIFLLPLGTVFSLLILIAIGGCPLERLLGILLYSGSICGRH